MDYIDQLEKILDLIKYFVSFDTQDENSGISLELLTDLWDSFVIKAFVTEESDVFYKWFIEILDPKSKIVIDINDLIEFYTQKFESFQGELVSKEAFKCFKEMFCIINEKQ